MTESGRILIDAAAEAAEAGNTAEGWELPHTGFLETARRALDGFMGRGGIPDTDNEDADAAAADTAPAAPAAQEYTDPEDAQKLRGQLAHDTARLTLRCALTGVLAGALGGVMSALFSVGGPPVSLYFSAATEEKEAYLATIQTYFLFSNIYIVALRAVHGIITKNVLLCSAFAVVGMALGTYLGSTVLRRISADAMRKTIYGMMAACGLAMILF